MLITGPPSLGQFAKNAIWEYAWSFNACNPPSIKELKSYIEGVNEVAFELFFGASFFGMRLEGTSSYLLELTTHCLECMYNSIDFDSYVSALGNHPQCGTLCNEITHIEVGAVNAWKSVGSFIMPKPSQALIEFDKLWPLLCSVQLSQDVDHLKAVELTYSEPVEHWVGIPVSLQEAPYSLSKDMFVDVLKKINASTCNC